MRLTDQQRQQAEYRIQIAMDSLLRGDIPPGGRCDLKTLARLADVNRTGFYPKNGVPGPYQHLAAEFDRRRQFLAQTDDTPDPRDAQIARLKDENAKFRARIAERDTTIEDLTSFKTTALSRLAAQHDELTRLRRPATTGPTVTIAPLHRPTAAPLDSPC
jgi:hypothetical protein